MSCTVASCPRRVKRSPFVVASQTNTSPDAVPAAYVVPPGEKAAPYISSFARG